MTKEAIENEEVQDVSANVDDDQQAETPDVELEAPRSLTPREEKLAALNKRHDESHTRFHDPDYDPEAEESAEEDVPEAEPPATPDAVKPESPVRLNEKGEWVMKLKVAGVEVERSLDQITATAQKHESADMRLQQASQRQRELDEYHSLLNQERQRLESQAKQNPQPSEQDAGQATQDDVKSLVAQHREYLYDGDTEKADEIMLQLISQGRQQPTLDTEALVNQAVSLSLQETERRNQQKEAALAKRDFDSSVQRGVEWLNDTYPDLVQDKDVFKFIDLKTEQIEKDHPDLTPEEVIKKAAEEVAIRFGKNKTNQQSSSREQNKSTIVPQPKRQANSRHSVPKKQEVDNSPGAVVERMKKQRQSVANRPV